MLLGSVRNGNEEYPIYKNPSPEELQKIKQISKSTDSVGDDFVSVVGLNGDVYFSPATLLHAAVVRSIRQHDPNENFSKNFVALSGSIDEGRVTNFQAHPEESLNETYDQQYEDIRNFDYFKDANSDSLDSTPGNSTKTLEAVEKLPVPNPLDEMNKQMLEKPNIHGDAKGKDSWQKSIGQVTNNDYSEAMRKLLNGISN